jgi:hypothetical protein
MCSYAIKLSDENIVAVMTIADDDNNNNNTLMGCHGHPTTVTISLEWCRCHHFGQKYDTYIHHCNMVHKYYDI